MVLINLINRLVIFADGVAASPVGMKVKGLPSFSSKDGKCEIRYEGRIFLGRTNHLSIKFLKVIILQYSAIFVACKD